MKKTGLILVVMVALVCFTALSFAQGQKKMSIKSKNIKMEVIKGEVVSIDVAKNEIVVKEKKSGVEKTISVDPDKIASLKVGEQVKIKVKAGSNKAESIKPIKEHKAKKPK